MGRPRWCILFFNIVSLNDREGIFCHHGGYGAKEKKKSGSIAIRMLPFRMGFVQFVFTM